MLYKGILQGVQVRGQVGTETSQGHGDPAERRGNVGMSGPIGARDPTGLGEHGQVRDLGIGALGS